MQIHVSHWPLDQERPKGKPEKSGAGAAYGVVEGRAKAAETLEARSAFRAPLEAPRLLPFARKREKNV